MWIPRLDFVLLSFGFTLALAPPPATSEEKTRTPIAVVEFDYLDTSGEATDQSAFHTERLEQFARDLRQDLGRSERFEVVPLSCDPEPCSLVDSEPSELVAAARRSGARLLLFGGIHKQSTLVQWAKVQVVDLPTEKVVFDRTLSFRGDDENAWRRAEAFLAKEILAEVSGFGRPQKEPARISRQSDP